MEKKVGRPGKGKQKVITVRLTPKMRFAVDLLARKHRRPSITELVEFALEELLWDKTAGLLYEEDDNKLSFLPDLVWDEDEVIRFVKLGLHCRDLLTFDEALIWRVIESDRAYWTEHRKPDYAKIKHEWDEIVKKALETRTSE